MKQKLRFTMIDDGLSYFFGMDESCLATDLMFNIPLQRNIETDPDLTGARLGRIVKDLRDRQRQRSHSRL